MSLKWVLGTFAAAAAVGAATALVGAGWVGSPAGADRARDGAARIVGGPSDAGLLSMWRRSRPAARATQAGADPVPGDATAPAALPGEGEPQLDEQLRRTDEALASSRRLSRPVEDEAGRPPAREARLAGAFRAAASLCRRAGRECRSSADCCPGLACAGGVAGYGTAGHCEGR